MTLRGTSLLQQVRQGEAIEGFLKYGFLKCIMQEKEVVVQKTLRGGVFNRAFQTLLLPSPLKEF